jgi:hypothetical protein
VALVALLNSKETVKQMELSAGIKVVEILFAFTLNPLLMEQNVVMMLSTAQVLLRGLMETVRPVKL